ncbi:hypothetical protein GCM10020220_063770 [Nonomuraea rubra]|uniref:ABATE domain-containing protein n=1 Tax=Nonomuraea rubra TaxID=46180 RepID=UPI0033820E6A
MSAEPVLPPAPGAGDYLAIDFVKQRHRAFLEGSSSISLGTPEATNRWLTERGLAPADAGVQEMCATQLRSLRDTSGRCSPPASAGCRPIPQPCPPSTTR